MKAAEIKYFYISFTILIMLAFSFSAYSQKHKNYLERKKERLEKSIEYADYLIDDAVGQKVATLQDLPLLQSKIDNRKSLIENYLQKQDKLFDTIFRNLLNVDAINTQLQGLKDEYALMIKSAYLNHNLYKRLVYVLAADDLNQAYSRFNYYKYYARQRNKQIEHIHQLEASYFCEVEKLNQKVEQNQHLLNELNHEYERLGHEIALKNKLIKELNAQVKQLVAKQANDKNSSLALEEKIKQIIDEESLNFQLVQPDRQLVNTPTPEEVLVSSGFIENRGKLPWPLERGIISARFGEQEHPDLEGVKIKNNGINILTHTGAVARSVFGGEVTRVLSVPNFNHVVILRHGDYLSVYSNLSQVFVEQGMIIPVKQEIGVVFTDNVTYKTELHFELWKAKEIQNPAEWLTPSPVDEAQKRNDP